MATFLDTDISKFAVEMALKEIIDLLKSASASRGMGSVYGNFVRQVLIPKNLDPKAPITLCDVDIYFERQEDVETFLEKEKARLLVDPHDPTKYLFCVHDTVLTRVTVTSQILNFDLDVDHFRAIVSKKGMIYLVHRGGMTFEDFREKVNRKECSLVDPDFFRFTDLKSEERQLEIASRIFFEFLRKGWKFILDSKVCDESTVKSPREFVNWIRFALEEKDRQSFIKFIEITKGLQVSTVQTLSREIDRVGPTYRQMAEKIIDSYAERSRLLNNYPLDETKSVTRDV